MRNRKKELRNFLLVWIVGFALAAIIGVYVLYQHYYGPGNVVSVSISSDAHYAITTDNKDFAIVWNLQKHTHQIVSRQANMYSAYWVKGTDDYLYQDWKNHEVFVRSAQGQSLQKFNPGFLSDGNVITRDLKTYIAANASLSDFWALYTVDTQTKSAHQFAGREAGDFKPMTFTLSNNNQQLLTSGDWGGVLWNLETLHALRIYNGNLGKTFSTFSPDNQYVVTADENSNQEVFKSNSNQRLFEIFMGEPMIGHKKNPDDPKDVEDVFDDNILPAPKDFRSDIEQGPFGVGGSTSSPTWAFLSVKFIDATHYLVFMTNVPYAILYDINNPKLLAYLPLGTSPLPAINYYERDQAIDTSPSAHILVMGKEHDGGILVYRYDPNHQTLSKIWDS